MNKYDSMGLTKYFNLKDSLDPEMILYMHPNLLSILVFVVQFCYQNNIECTVTSGIRSVQENRRVGSRSQTHVQGRAFDLRTSSIPQSLIYELTETVENDFKHVGAISSVTYKSRPVVYGDENHMDHIHFQVRP